MEKLSTYYVKAINSAVGNTNGEEFIHWRVKDNFGNYVVIKDVFGDQQTLTVVGEPFMLNECNGIFDICYIIRQAIMEHYTEDHEFLNEAFLDEKKIDLKMR